MPADPESVNCVLLGFTNAAAARAAYLAHQPPGAACGPVVALTAAEFRRWLAEGDRSKPVEAKWRKGPFKYAAGEESELYAALPSGLTPGPLDPHETTPAMKPGSNPLREAGMGRLSHPGTMAAAVHERFPGRAGSIFHAASTLGPGHPFTQWLENRHQAGDYPRGVDELKALTRFAADAVHMPTLGGVVADDPPLNLGLARHAALRTRRLGTVSSGYNGARGTLTAYRPEQTKAGHWVWRETGPVDLPLSKGRYYKRYNVSYTDPDKVYGGSLHNKKLDAGELSAAGITGTDRALWDRDLLRDAQYYPYLTDEIRKAAFPGWNPEFGSPPPWQQASLNQLDALKELHRQHRAETAKVKEIPVKDGAAFLAKVYGKHGGGQIDTLPLTLPKDDPLVRVPPRPGDHVRFVDQQTKEPILLGRFAEGDRSRPGFVPGTPLGFDQDAGNYHFKIDLRHGQDPREVTANHYAAAGDRLPGGRADDRPDSDFDPEELAKGTKVEMEHTDDPDVAAEIARDHLAEDPDYYRKLARMEGAAHAQADDFWVDYAKKPGALPPEPQLPATLRRKGASAPRTPAAIAPEGTGVLHPGLTKPAGVEVPGASFPQPPGLRAKEAPAVPPPAVAPPPAQPAPQSSPAAELPRGELEGSGPALGRLLGSGRPWHQIAPEVRESVKARLLAMKPRDLAKVLEAAAPGLAQTAATPAGREARALVHEVLAALPPGPKIDLEEAPGGAHAFDPDHPALAGRGKAQAALAKVNWLPSVRGVPGAFVLPSGLSAEGLAEIAGVPGAVVPLPPDVVPGDAPPGVAHAARVDWGKVPPQRRASARKKLADAGATPLDEGEGIYRVPPDVDLDEAMGTQGASQRLFAAEPPPGGKAIRPMGRRFAEDEVHPLQNYFLKHEQHSERLAEEINKTEYRARATTPVTVGTITLSPDEANTSLLPLLYNQDLPRLGSKNHLVDIAHYLTQRSLKALGGRPLAYDTPEEWQRSRGIASRVMGAEAVEAARRNGSAVEWYKKSLLRARDVIGLWAPEVLTDPYSRMAYNIALAITSGGNDVISNGADADYAYHVLKASRGKALPMGAFPEDFGKGPQAKAWKSSFAAWNRLTQRLGSPAAVTRFLSAEFAVRDLERMGYEVSGENADTMVSGAIIFGPKIGNGFFRNLEGDYGRLTMDRWFMRTVGRYAGNLVSFDPHVVQASLERFHRALVTGGDQSEVVRDIKAGAGQRHGLYHGYADLFHDPRAIYNAAREINAAYARSGFTDKTEIARAAKGLVETLGLPKDAPSSGTERNFWRDVSSEALRFVHENGFRQMEMADLQAVLWYPEKELFDKLGYQEGAATDDYETAMRQVAAARGLTEQQVEAAVQKGEHSRRPQARRRP